MTAKIEDGVIYDEMSECYEASCLAGEDVTRTPGTLLVAVEDGVLIDPSLEFDAPLQTGPGGDLVGWGPLNGPSYIVKPEGCGWFVNVPRPAWDALLKHAGMPPVTMEEVSP